MIDLKNIDVFLFDMDGTLNMGDVPIKGAMDTLRILEKKGKQICFVTNNSSKSKFDYFHKMEKMGYNAKL